MALYLNALGFSSTKWEKLLKNKITHKPSSSRKNIEPNEDHDDDNMAQQITNIKRSIKLRPAARNNLKLCAVIKKTGGCTKAFDSEDDLAKHILHSFGREWQNHIILN